MPKLDHVALEVSDLGRALAFYTDILGLRLMYQQVDEEHHEAFAFLELEGGNLELLQCLDENNRPAPFAPPAPRPSQCPHVAIQADNLDELAERLLARGVARLKGPLEIPGQVRWAYFADPDGNVLEFVQWLNA